MTAVEDSSRAKNEKIDSPAFSPSGDSLLGPWKKIARRTIENNEVKIVLENGEMLKFHRFALVGSKDSVRLEPDSKVSVSGPKESSQSVTVRPVWRMQKTITICGQKVKTIIKEIEKEDELAGYEALRQHHYRNGKGVARRALLIAKANTKDLPKVIGFVEISSCFLVNALRKQILNAPFKDDEYGIEWKQWDRKTAKDYTNIIARISRCVVYPEVRGIGIAGILAEAAKRFTIDRWHIGGLRPSFLEITAEMLRYWPFVEKAGFIKVGETEGNGKRLEKSMHYLLQRKQNEQKFPKGGGGILSMHRSHASLLENLMKERNYSVEDIITRIKKTPEKLSVKDWVALHDIYRRPKPVYMLGLTSDAKKYLSKRLKKSSDDEVAHTRKRSKEVLFLLNKIDIKASCKPENSPEARQIQEAFNIVSERLETVIVSKLDMDLRGGIIMVTGASGSGKSLLLNTLAWHASGRKKRWKLPPEIQSEACMDTPPTKVEMMTPLSCDKSLSPIALLMAIGASLEESMRLLASAGLGEAQLFVRPAKTLSSGQRYRLSLALSLAKKPDLLLIDEFCEPLDNYAVAAVCRRLRKEVQHRGIIAIVATINDERILSELRPQRILRLLPNGWHKWEK